MISRTVQAHAVTDPIIAVANPIMDVINAVITLPTGSTRRKVSDLAKMAENSARERWLSDVTWVSFYLVSSKQGLMV